MDEASVGWSVLYRVESTSLYGEIGKLWASGGDARTRSGVNGSLGVKVPSCAESPSHGNLGGNGAFLFDRATASNSLDQRAPLNDPINLFREPTLAHLLHRLIQEKAEWIQRCFASGDHGHGSRKVRAGLAGLSTGNIASAQ